MKYFLSFLLGGAAASWFRSTSSDYPSSLQCSTSKSPFSTTEYRPFTLMSFSDETHDTRVLRFALPAADMPLNIVPASCLTFRYVDKNGKEVVRPFTPISRSDQRGYFEVLVKQNEDSSAGNHFFSLQQGDTVEMKGPWVQLPIKANQYKTIGMIASGTGVAPMYQVARHVLSQPKNTTGVSLLYANERMEDVALGNELNDLMRNFPNFSSYFMLSKAPRNWMGGVGQVNKDVIKALMPAPQQAMDSIILVSGPTTFMETVSGVKDTRKCPPGQGDLRGYLKELGYLPRMIYKL